MKIITESMVEKYLTMPDCIDAMRTAMIAVSKGETTLPIRQYMPIPDTQGKMALMPGTLSDPACYGIKLVCKYVREPNSPYGTHVGMVLVFDSVKGLPLAMIEGASLTAIRTAAASAMATDYLANRNVATLGIMGYGEQARRHVLSMLAVRDLKNILIWGRDPKKSQSFAEKLSDEIDRKITPVSSAKDLATKSDLICTTTSSARPILKGKWVQPGTHINLVGAAIASSAEADEELVTRSKYFTDYRPAAMAAAGELIDAIDSGAVTKSHILAEIGEVAAATQQGRISPAEITVYKSLGVSAQDLAAGHKLYEMAVRDDFGIDINMMDYPE